MNDSTDLQQRMLELVYDLLPPDEAVVLREQIATDPAAAKAYADAQRSSQLMATAARLESPRVPLAPPAAVNPAVPSRRVGAAPSRLASWGIALAATLLLACTVGGYLYHRAALNNLASEHVRLIVTGPAQLHAGIENNYQVQTTTVAGKPLKSTIEYAVFSPTGDELLRTKQATAADGRTVLTMPPTLPLTTGTRLEVLTAHAGEIEKVNTRLAVEPRRFVTQLALDKPLYQPGETVYYRSLTLSRHSLQPPGSAAVQFTIQDPSGAVVANSEASGVTDRGVGSGAFEIPAELPGGEYTLFARSPQATFPEEKRKFFVRRYRLPRLKKELEFVRDSYAPGDTVVADFSAQRSEGGAAAETALVITATVDGQSLLQSEAKTTASGTYRVEFQLPEQIETGAGQLALVIDDGGVKETLAKTIPINLGKVDVQFFPEGGDLVAGLRQRVYFTGSDPLGEPVDVRGTVVDAQDKQVAEIRTTHEGLGSFWFEPQAGKNYRLKIASPPDVKSEPPLPAVKKDAQVVLSTGDGVFVAAKPLEFKLEATRGKLPLVVSAQCRGVQVAEQAVVSKLGTNNVSLPLPDSVGGVVCVTVYDYSQEPPKPVAERLVYRRPARRLDVQVTDHSEKYSPGEPVELSLMVRDERGQNVPATLGVAVVDDALLNLADDDTPRMTTHFLLTSEVEKPEDLDDADFYLSPGAKAEQALDLLLGTQGWRRFVEKTLEQLRKEGKPEEQLARLAMLGGEAMPPAMFDNLTRIQPLYQESLAAYSHERTRVLGTASLLGGLAMFVLLALMVAMKLSTAARVWAPCLAAAAGCLVIGVLWLTSEGQASRGATPVAYHSFHREPAALALGDQIDALGRDNGATKLNLLYAIPADEHAAAGLDFDKSQLQWLAWRRGNQDRWDFGMQDGAVPQEFKGIKRPALELRAIQDGFGRNAGGERVGFRGFGNGEIDELGKLRAVRLRELAEDRDDAILYDPYGVPQFTVREYAHRHTAGEPGVRSDFADTLYWHPLVIADANGRAKIKFDLSDSVTAFRVLADAHDGQGRLGGGEGEIVSRMPFNMQPKLPLEVTAGDRIDLPLALVNDSLSPLDLKLSLTHNDLLRLDGPSQYTWELKARERSRRYFPLDVIGQTGQASLEFRGLAGNLSDAVKESIAVVPPGFPTSQSYSGRLAGEQELLVRLPQDWVPGSLEVSLQLFPSMLSDLQQGMESILREPCGCFEQASTSNYPNVLALQYMSQHKVANPEFTRRAKELLASGYRRLTGYECPQKGYEWFGGNPGHEALTAYGLLEFRDMAEIHSVDEGMLQRTADWLLSRRDGKGGFLRNERALDSFGAAPADITNAYIVWALSESGQQGIEAELKHVADLGGRSDDSYLVALAAACTLNAGEPETARPLLDKLAQSQAADGHLAGKQGSITRSGGLSLSVETTALAALAWLKSEKYGEHAEKAIGWIVKHRSGGGFGSTQATILALKALVAHAKSHSKTASAGELIVKSEGEVLASKPFAAGEQNTIRVEGIAARLKAGDNQLQLNLSGDNQMPYALDVSFRSRQPSSDDACPLRLSTKLSSAAVGAGKTVQLSAEVTNSTEQGQPMTVAIVGLPAGLEPRADQLEALKKAGTVDYYETRPRELIFYWRALAPSRRVPLELDLVAELPGQYTAPASRVYLYYTPEQKQWTAPLTIDIDR